MGVIFLEHPGSSGGGGSGVFSCATCSAPLAPRAALQSPRFHGATGRAYLFRPRVPNLVSGPTHARTLLTGRHFVRDVACRRCGTKLGWRYEMALEDSQRFKEGSVVLERALVTEEEEWEGGLEANSTASSGSSDMNWYG